MEEFKSASSRLARLFKKSRDAWKAKSLDKQRRLRAAQVKIRDLEQSRERWKRRALEAEQALGRGQGEGQAPDEEADAGAGSGKALRVPQHTVALRLLIGHLHKGRDGFYQALQAIRLPSETEQQLEQIARQQGIRLNKFPIYRGNCLHEAPAKRYNPRFPLNGNAGTRRSGRCLPHAPVFILV